MLPSNSHTPANKISISKSNINIDDRSYQSESMKNLKIDEMLEKTQEDKVFNPAFKIQEKLKSRVIDKMKQNKGVNNIKYWKSSNVAAKNHPIMKHINIDKQSLNLHKLARLS